MEDHQRINDETAARLMEAIERRDRFLVRVEPKPARKRNACGMQTRGYEVTDPRGRVSVHADLAVAKLCKGEMHELVRADDARAFIAEAFREGAIR